MANECSIEHGSNFATVTLGKLTVAFSYQTVIGFSSGIRWLISENLWGPTTGKHLNALPGGSDKSRRLPRQEFEEALHAALSSFGLVLGDKP